MQNNERGHRIIWRYQTLQLIPENRPLVIKIPPTAPSGVNSFFPGKVIMGNVNGITWEVLTGYGQTW